MQQAKVEEESYQDYDVTCTVFKVGYDFTKGNQEAQIFYRKDRVEEDEKKISFAVRQQVKSTEFRLADRKKKPILP